MTSAALLDYGSGNLHSAQRALVRVGADVTVTADPEIALAEDGLVIPGVGAFAACMEGLLSVPCWRSWCSPRPVASSVWSEPPTATPPQLVRTTSCRVARVIAT
jgi:hypothetical protein